MIYQISMQQFLVLSSKFSPWKASFIIQPPSPLEFPGPLTPPPPTPLGFPMGYEYGTPFKGYFTKIEHNINTRNNGCSLKLPKAKLEFGRRSFAFQGALVYNTLPRHLRNLNSRFLFKSNLKEFFQQYSIIHNSFQSYKSIIFTDFDF